MGNPVITSVVLLALALVLPLADGVERLRALRAHHRRNFFMTLLKDYREAPKDKTGFVAKCSEIVDDLLPELREEYTERQLPHVLSHSCEEYKIKEDFRQNHTLDNGTALIRSRVRCQYFAKMLAADYSKRKDLKSWCGKVWGFLEEQELSPSEARRRLKEVQDIRNHLDALKADQLRAFSHIGRAKFKRMLAPWAPYNGTNGTEEDNVTGDNTDDGSDPQAADEAKEWLNCCPMDCKVCAGFQVVKGVVRVQLQANGTVSRVRTRVSSGRAEEADTDGEDDDDEDEEDDSDDQDPRDEDSDEDGDFPDPKMETDDSTGTEEDEDSQGCADDDPNCQSDSQGDDDADDDADEGEFLQKRKGRARRTGRRFLAKLRRHSKGKDIYHMLVKEFEKIELFPKHMKTKPFIDTCTGIITDLMPKLQHEYTWNQVPNILLHECDVYTSKEDFRTKLMRLEHAKQTCVFFAKRLGDQFKHKQDYKEWCSNVYAQMLRSSNITNMTDRQKQLLENRPDLSRKVYARQMSAECCPPNCRYCE